MYASVLDSKMADHYTYSLTVSIIFVKCVLPIFRKWSVLSTENLSKAATYQYSATPSQDLASYVLTPTSRNDVTTRQNKREDILHNKCTFIKEIDMTKQQIVSFMCFGKDRDIITSAGALSHQFGNTGLYLILPGRDEVIRFGEEHSRYDGLSYSLDHLVAFNRTKHRIEVFRYDIDWKHPTFSSLFDLVGVVERLPENSEVSLCSYFASQQTLHVLCPGFECVHTLQVDRNSWREFRKGTTKFPSSTAKVPILANNDTKWYIDGDKLTRRHNIISGSERHETQRFMMLANLDEQQPFGSNRILYTVKGSSAVFVLKLNKLCSSVSGDAPLIHCHEQQPCITLEKKHDVLKIAGSSDGWVSVLVAGSGRKLLRLYASHQVQRETTNSVPLKTIQRTYTAPGPGNIMIGISIAMIALYSLFSIYIFYHISSTIIEFLRHYFNHFSLFSLLDDLVAWIWSLFFFLFFNSGLVNFLKWSGYLLPE